MEELTPNETNGSAKDNSKEITQSTGTSSENAMILTENPSNNTSLNIRSEKGLPKAMVKPSIVNQQNILTHVIEGFVIQEGNEPFPVTRLRCSSDFDGEPPSKLIAHKISVTGL